MNIISITPAPRKEDAYVDIRVCVSDTEYLGFKRQSAILIKVMKVIKSQNVMEDINNIVCQYFNVTKEDLQSKGRTQKFVTPRRLAYYLMRKYTTIGLAQIGMFYDRDHATVMHNCRVYEGLLDVYPEEKETLKKLEFEIRRAGIEEPFN